MTAASLNKTSQYVKDLLDGLNKLPYTWALTPVKGDKRPYRKNWQNENPLSREVLIEEIKSGKAKGYGLRTGIVSGGIVAVDADGHAAHAKILELSNGEPLPDTVAFTSDKPGRCQYLFYIPQEYWAAIATKKISTGVKGDDGKEQKLELRWDGCQSVLPPSVHPETGFYRWRKSLSEIVIAPAPMWLIEAMLVSSGETEAPVINHQPKTKKQLSENDLSEIEWALSYLNALSPSRADDYDDWLAVGMALHSLNENTLLLEWDDWSKLSSKYKVGECEKKWKSFKPSGVAIGTLAHMAKQDGWKSPLKSKASGRNYSGGIGSGGSSGGSGGDGGDGGETKVIKFPSIQELTESQVNGLIDEIIEKGLTNGALNAALNGISHRTPWRIDQLYKLHQQKLEDIERIELRDNTREQLESLLSASTASLDINNYLHPNLAKPLLHLASRLSLKPELYLTTLLTVCSSLHHSLTRIWLSKEDDFDQSANLYFAIIAPSSQKKSPVIKAIATKPLRVLQREIDREYMLQLEAYEKELKEWERNKSPDKGMKPEKPERAIHYFTKATGEGLEYQASRQPDQGMLFLSDELPAIIYGQNAYRQGKGSDKQDILSYYDGTGNVTLRAAEGVKSELDSILLSILGGVQPKVMQKLLADCEDSDGNWARFIFVNQPAVAARLHPDGGQIDLTGLLSGLYRDIRSLPPMEYTLSMEAFKLFQCAYDRYEQNRVNDALVGMQSVWGKCEGRVGRLALNLHVINALAANKIPSSEIGADTMRCAIALTDYYALQVKALYTEFSDSEALAAHLAKVIEMSLKCLKSKNEGWLKASDVYLSITKKQRPSGETVREWFCELVTLGKGEVKGVGRSLLFRAFSPTDPPPKPKLDEIRQVLDKSSNTETTIYQGVQEKLDKLDKLDDFQKNTTNTMETLEVEAPSTTGLEKTLVLDSLSNESSNLAEVAKEPMEVQAIETEVPSATDLKKSLVLEESSNLSNFAENMQLEQVTALDNRSNESSNLDELDDLVKNEPIDFSDIIARTNIEIKRIGWSKEKGKEYLLQTYGKGSRQLLTDKELVEFLRHLEAQPTPELENSIDNVEAQSAQLDLITPEPVKTQPITQQPNKKGKRVRIEKPENFIIECGEGVVVDDRGDGSIEVMMQTGKRAGIHQVVTKGYVVLDE